MRKIFTLLMVFVMLCLFCACGDIMTNFESTESEKESYSTLQDCPSTNARVLKEGLCGVDLEWILYEDGLLCIFGHGDMFYTPDSEDVEWYAEREKIKNVYIADEVTEISQFAFKDCTNLETLRLPKTIKKIRLSAFQSCSQLKELTLYDGIENIEYWAFSNCESLVQINIPGTIKNLDNYTFTGCSNVKSITISEGVETIGFDVFEDCINLESVTIPQSLNKIDVYTFRNCPNLKDVYYAGTEAEWNSISISQNGNEQLINANIHFEYSGNES